MYAQPWDYDEESQNAQKMVYQWRALVNTVMNFCSIKFWEVLE
jgi:hypothetical protein